MMQKKPSLGRGLEALMGSGVLRPSLTPLGALPAAAQSPAVQPAVPPSEELAKLPLDQLQRGRYQPRIDMRPESLQELADSIKAQGVVQPIVVRPIDGPLPGVDARVTPPEGLGADSAAARGARYEIIAGERRWRAAQMAGLTEIPAVIRRIPDEAAIAVALIENIQREDLNPLEEARALDRLIREFQMTHQEAAEAVGRSRATVSNLLRLLDLPGEVAELVERRELEMGHARALLALPGRRQQAEVGALVAKKSISVRETEAIVRRMLAPGRAAEPADEAARDPDVQRLERDLAEKLGARVAIRHSGSGKGRLVIDYNSLDELDGILAHIQ
ncbi:MAG TPA: ParB/RepB/Spo0J family partition protein [Steroidobacteraceae bacterium]|nr:ParB/RepB/Spo0J family partition protein [Steroidobacteraceae bacterium]